jgi:serine/threonine protein kinase
MSDTLASTQKLTRPPQAPAPVTRRVQAVHDALAPGTHLEEFEIIRVLGAGGFGIVYLAIDHVLQRQVAIKEYMPNALAGRGDGAALVMRSPDLGETFALGLQSFFNEARLLACFDHPSLVKVYRCWKAHGTAYMAMQYYPGVTLRQARRGMAAALDEGRLRAFVESLLDVLELLHAQGVYHRDVAPDNILLLPDGRPVLLDFGSARRVIGDATQTLTAVLKPSFAPIEQYAEVTGMRQGPWTDIYALGATVYFMLTGDAPTPAVLRAVRDTLPALSVPGGAGFAGVPDRLLALVDWSLALAPEDRPQDVRTVRQALHGQVQPPAAPTRPRIDPSRFRDDVDDARTVDLSSAFDTMSACPNATIEPKPSSAAADAASSWPRRARSALAALALSGLAILALSLKAPAPAATAASMSDEPLARADAQGTRPAAPPLAPPATPSAAAAREPAARDGTTVEPADSSLQAAPRRSSAPPGVAVARRALPDRRAPSPEAACGNLNYFAAATCISRECQNPRWRAHPQCANARAMEERRQRQVDQF